MFYYRFFFGFNSLNFMKILLILGMVFGFMWFVNVIILVVVGDFLILFICVVFEDCICIVEIFLVNCGIEIVIYCI